MIPHLTKIGLTLGMWLIASACTTPLLTQRHPRLNRTVAPNTAEKIEPDHTGEKMAVPVDGHVTLVYFWGSFCPPCFDQLSALETIWRKYRDQSVSFVAVSIDLDRDNAAMAYQKTAATFPCLWDQSEQIRRSFGVEYQVPRLFVLDKQRRLRQFFKGTAAHEEGKKERLHAIEAAIAELSTGQS